MKTQIRFRIIVEKPLKGAIYAVQRGKNNVLPPTSATDSELAFDFALVLADIDAEPPRLTGEFAQGPASARFVYVSSGTLAGQTFSCWTRRAKVPLYRIQRSLLAEVLSRGPEAALLEARIHGLSKDGGPACGTVPLLSEWSIAPLSQ